MFLLSLGEVIHDLRTQKGLSQQELADLVGAHRTYVSDIERGARNLTVVTVCHIAHALQISYSQLFRLAEERMDPGDEVEEDISVNGEHS
jgi:transcriptional regulator with XRE-family HTH domain